MLFGLFKKKKAESPPPEAPVVLAPTPEPSVPRPAPRGTAPPTVQPTMDRWLDQQLAMRHPDSGQVHKAEELVGAALIMLGRAEGMMFGMITSAARIPDAPARAEQIRLMLRAWAEQAKGDWRASLQARIRTAGLEGWLGLTLPPPRRKECTQSIVLDYPVAVTDFDSDQPLGDLELVSGLEAELRGEVPSPYVATQLALVQLEDRLVARLILATPHHHDERELAELQERPFAEWRLRPHFKPPEELEICIEGPALRVQQTVRASRR